MGVEGCIFFKFFLSWHRKKLISINFILSEKVFSNVQEFSEEDKQLTFELEMTKEGFELNPSGYGRDCRLGTHVLNEIYRPRAPDFEIAQKTLDVLAKDLF